jgi:trans-aconitate methyltransferase
MVHVYAPAVNVRDAVELIQAAISPGVQTWADLGAGEGTFTRELAELLNPGSRIYAVDRDVRAVSALERWAGRATSELIPVRADFSKPFTLPGLATARLDGLLLANALHFASDASEVLSRLAAWLAPHGRVVLVEYDRRPASRWVPHPVPFERFEVMAQGAGLMPPRLVGTRPSAYGGALYAAFAIRA